MNSTYIKWGIGLIIILAVILLFYRSQHLHRQYKYEAKEGLERTQNLESTILTERDIAHLPEPVQRYLRYVGVVGKEKVKNLRLTIDGEMRMDEKRGWAKVKVQQYSFINQITRLFYINLNMSGIPVYGLHSYQKGNASMLVKIAGLIPVVDGQGEKMNQGETVTVLNDMCLLAPATLIDERIEWEPIDSLSAKATFTNEGITVSATLYFNEQGQLINFVSDDRFYSPTGETYESVRWSTPLSNYKNINGYNLASYGEAIWNFPDRDYCYAKFNINEIEYNVDTMN